MSESNNTVGLYEVKEGVLDVLRSAQFLTFEGFKDRLDKSINKYEKTALSLIDELGFNVEGYVYRLELYDDNLVIKIRTDSNGEMEIWYHKDSVVAVSQRRVGQFTIFKSNRMEILTLE
ncbi:hypothetical protein COF68_05635 [Bacillus toyonensis]|uniref:hypothetical protein n=1 Tax=Bacillus toyonensis TaxID=155322 RepID=UPI000BFC0C74|nr:hypothetical protein [Bacillus toyonensis]PHE64324.1 hypothetical protein COF68_05635 [Bacillus toyonensis]